ncbi:hypothetical protein AOLI_G00014610 [Acnodon oligacanthus]
MARLHQSSVTEAVQVDSEPLLRSRAAVFSAITAASVGGAWQPRPQPSSRSAGRLSRGATQPRQPPAFRRPPLL